MTETSPEALAILSELEKLDSQRNILMARLCMLLGRETGRKGGKNRITATQAVARIRSQK